MSFVLALAKELLKFFYGALKPPPPPHPPVGLALTLLALGFFGCCRTGGSVSTPLHNSFVFKVRLLKFYTEIRWDKMNILR